MATVNPFADNDQKGEAWELGYLAGFHEPDEDHFLPYSPELLDVYKLGEHEGKKDWSEGLPEGESWVRELAAELLEHVSIHALGVGLEKIGIVAGGLISLVLTVITIPGDVQLRPLEADWEGPADEGDASYVVVCGQKDHPMVVEGTTSDGYWVGPPRSNFKAALSDFRQHGHAEALIARCSVNEATCGPVWPIE